MDSTIHSKNLKNISDGLSLMIFFTFIWTLIAEAALDNWNYRISGLIFFAIIATLIFYYLKLKKILKLYGKELNEPMTPEDKKKNKWFLIIFISEGVLILITLNVLVNIKMSQLFIPCFALIVGLHFYPLGILFRRKFNYYVASWMTIISVTGLFLSINKIMDQDFITAFTGFGCAAGTSMMGAYMIYHGRKFGRLLEK